MLLKPTAKRVLAERLGQIGRALSVAPARVLELLHPRCSRRCSANRAIRCLKWLSGRKALVSPFCGRHCVSRAIDCTGRASTPRDLSHFLPATSYPTGMRNPIGFSWGLAVGMVDGAPYHRYHYQKQSLQSVYMIYVCDAQLIVVSRTPTFILDGYPGGQDSSPHQHWERITKRIQLFQADSWPEFLKPPFDPSCYTNIPSGPAALQNLRERLSYGCLLHFEDSVCMLSSVERGMIASVGF